MELDGEGEEDLHEAEVGHVPQEGVDGGVPVVVTEHDQPLLRQSSHLFHAVHQVAQVL